MKLDRNRLSCDRCRRKFKNEVILEYHKVRCSSKWQSDKVSMKPQEKWIGGKKEKTVLVKKQVKVEQQANDNEHDNDLDLAFFSTKNLELASEADLVSKLESHLGVLATLFDGEIDVASVDGEQTLGCEQPAGEEGETVDNGFPETTATKDIVTMKANKLKQEIMSEGTSGQLDIAKDIVNDDLQVSDSDGSDHEHDLTIVDNDDTPPSQTQIYCSDF